MRALKQHGLWLFYVSAAALYATNVFAINPASNLPIDIESDRATLDDEKGISSYSGNVIITQGLSRLEADEITVKAADRKIVSIQAAGTPAYFIQQDDEKSPVTRGHANMIMYLAKEAILKFQGEASLIQADNSFLGEQIEYDILNKAIKAEGDKEQGSRVKIQYHPEKNENQINPLSSPATDTKTQNK